MCVSQKLLCSKYQNYRISLYLSSFLQVGWIFLCSCLSLLLPDKFKYDSCVVCEKLGPSWSMSLALLSDECMRLDDLGPFSLCRYWSMQMMFCWIHLLSCIVHLVSRAKL
ncbi:hypothetical protein AtEden1_Chr2g0237531 [Arabidopsis thaliana]